MFLLRELDCDSLLSFLETIAAFAKRVFIHISFSVTILCYRTPKIGKLVNTFQLCRILIETCMSQVILA